MNAEACEPYHTSSTLFRRRASHPACGPRKGEAHRPFRAKAAFSDASSATSSAWFGFQSRRESRSPESKKAGIRAESLEPVRTSESPITVGSLLLVGVMYFHDKGTNRRVMLIGLMFCTAFVLVSFFARPQPENDRVLVKADRLTLTAGKPPLAN